MVTLAQIIRAALFALAVSGAEGVSENRFSRDLDGGVAWTA
jgi:hypothetical protein